MRSNLKIPNHNHLKQERLSDPNAAELAGTGIGPETEWDLSELHREAVIRNKN